MTRIATEPPLNQVKPAPLPAPPRKWTPWPQRHICTYEEVTRRFTTPASGLTRVKGNADEAAMLVYGFTVVEMRCAFCGRTTFETAPGDQRQSASSR